MTELYLFIASLRRHVPPPPDPTQIDNLERFVTSIREEKRSFVLTMINRMLAQNASLRESLNRVNGDIQTMLGHLYVRGHLKRALSHPREEQPHFKRRREE